MRQSIEKLVQRFLEDERPIGNILDDDIILAQCIAAANFYAAYGDLFEHLEIEIPSPPPCPRLEFPIITSDTEITMSEWGVIHSLFLIYIEREQALHLEASRGLGVDVFGRSSSEIENDVVSKEEEVKWEAFSFPIITI